MGIEIVTDHRGPLARAVIVNTTHERAYPWVFLRHNGLDGDEIAELFIAHVEADSPGAWRRSPLDKAAATRLCRLHDEFAAAFAELSAEEAQAKIEEVRRGQA